MLERNETWHIFNQHCSRSKGIDKTEIFTEKMVSRVLIGSNGRVDGKPLARGTARKQIELATIHPKAVHHFSGINFPNVASEHFGAGVIKCVCRCVGLNKLIGKDAVKASVA